MAENPVTGLPLVAADDHLGEPDVFGESACHGCGWLFVPSDPHPLHQQNCTRSCTRSPCEYHDRVVAAMEQAGMRPHHPQRQPRLSVNMSPETVEKLNEVRAELGMSATSTVGAAIATLHFLLEETRGGDKLLLRDRNGSSREVLLPWKGKRR